MSSPVLDAPGHTPKAQRNGRVGGGLLDPRQLLTSLPDALMKLNPATLWRNPVMFIVEAGAAFTTVLAVLRPSLFAWAIVVWLWLTVVFANLAEAVAEGQGKAQAATLRAAKRDTTARRLKSRTSADWDVVGAPELRQGDFVVVEAGEIIPGDGDVVEGIASVDESAITGESAPVIRESGGDRSAVTGGTRVLSDRIVVEITQKPGESFIDRMIALVEGADRQKTPNEIALNILLAALTIIFLVATATMQPLAIYSMAINPGVPDSLALTADGVSGIVLVSLIVCLIPTTIGALLSAIGIAGMDRLVQRNVLAMSGRAVEAAGDVSTLLLDKTGTITLGNRQASEFVPVAGVTEEELAEAAQLSSLADETPEGRSIVVFAKQRYGLREREIHGAQWVQFTAQTRMSGVDLGDRQVRKGAATAVMKWARDQGGHPTDEVGHLVDGISGSGGTPLVVAEKGRVLGIIHLKDVVKQGMRERFDEMRRMGIRTVMITGDNPLTAKAIADEAGVDDYLAEATPEDKLTLIRKEQEGGRLVAMTGDGTNDAPALAQADVGVTMNTGTSAAKEAGNMVDLDSNPTKLIEIVEIGKQLLITRGALTTFSIANDIAKYFAIIPAMFAAVYPGLDALNIMRLASPQSAILAAAAGVAQALFNGKANGSIVQRNGKDVGSVLIGQSFTGEDGKPIGKYFQSRPSAAGDGYDPTSTSASNLGPGDVVDVPGGRQSLLTQVCARSKAIGELEGVSGARPYCTADGVGAVLRVFPGRAVSVNQACPATPFIATYQGREVECAKPGEDYAAGRTIPIRGDVGVVKVPADAVTASGSGLDPHISPAYAELQAPRVAKERGIALDQVKRLIEANTTGRALGFMGEPAVNVLELNLALDGS